MWDTDTPEAVGLDPLRWSAALHLVRTWCESGALPAAALIVGQKGRLTEPQFFGRQKLADPPGSLRRDAIFLIASITKPIVAMGALLLVERGLLTLGDRVIDHLPEFGQNGKSGVTIRHLLTHTSGLPDMLPNNQQLRMANAPLMNFVEDTCATPLSFPPGRAVQYSSMGFAVLGAIIEQHAGRSCSEFLAEEFFRPLGMRETALGAPPSWFEGADPLVDRIPELKLPPDQQHAEHWGWNSRYWRSLGAPWGGLLTTPRDLAAFAILMLERGAWGDLQLLSPATIANATRNQLESLRDVPADDRRIRPWGLGWRLNWPAHSANFGDLLGPRTYGHWGATGTVMWLDPEEDRFAIFLTNQPQEPHGRYLARLSNAVAAAFRPRSASH